MFASFKNYIRSTILNRRKPEIHFKGDVLIRRMNDLCSHYEWIYNQLDQHHSDAVYHHADMRPLHFNLHFIMQRREAEKRIQFFKLMGQVFKPDLVYEFSIEEAEALELGLY